MQKRKRPLEVAKADRVRGRKFKAKYTMAEYKLGCSTAYALGLMDGEEGRVVKPDATGFYSRVRIKRKGSKANRDSEHRGTDQSKSPHYVQLQRDFDKRWITIELLPHQDSALALLEDVVLVLARMETRSKPLGNQRRQGQE